MVRSKKVVCVLPAYNAAKTLALTLQEIPTGIVDHFVIVDDGSTDATLKIAEELKNQYSLEIITHGKNLGYGANQKTCYNHALSLNADIIVMLHPDYQYDPRLLGSMVEMIASEVYDLALGSRVLGQGALAGGMPLYKYISNRALSFIQNLILNQNLSEYHTGYRAYSSRLLRTLAFQNYSDDFVFDNEILVQSTLAGFNIGEISVPAKYFAEASTIGFSRSVRYGFGVLRCSLDALVFRLSLWPSRSQKHQNKLTALNVPETCK